MAEQMKALGIELFERARAAGRLRGDITWLDVEYLRCLSLFRWELEDLAREQLAGMPPECSSRCPTSWTRS
ncbi:MAG TPA: hypothetical protein VF933_12340 [Streptosporangiaceae bacterium]